MNATTEQPKENIDHAEVNKFEELASRWWDPQSEFKPLHDINPLRLNYINQNAHITGKKIIDIGCGGGILSESMAAHGATVIGIDAGKAPLTVAKLHALEANIQVDYRNITAEQIAVEMPESFDVITCMELLEHVPDPASLITACAKLVKPGGHLFFSTINRNPKSYLLAIVGAEYVMNMLPKGTHDFEKFIRPSEMDQWCRQAGLEIQNITGMSYNPLTRCYSATKNVDVNYILHAVRPEE
jgi:2-polyprenyl-6-hydroxyphenyl methylase/3-demethylubiquinone-9 3-methyltransferase